MRIPIADWLMFHRLLSSPKISKLPLFFEGRKILSITLDRETTVAYISYPESVKRELLSH